MKKNILVIIGILALAAVGFFGVRNGWFDRVIPNSETRDWHEYTSPNYGYVIKYPQTWVIEPNNEGGDSITFSDPDDFLQEITVAIADPEVIDIIRGALTIEEETEITVDEIPGQKLVSRAAEGGQLTTIVMVEHLGRLYYIVGSADEFDLIIENFRFVE